MQALDLVTTVTLGTMVGVEASVAMFINPALWATEARDTLRYLADLLGRVMPFWYILSLLLLAFESWRRRGQPGFTEVLSALLLLALVIVLTLVFLLPINKRLATEGITGEQGWQQHRLWDSRHRLRVVALLVSLVLFLHAV